MSDDALFSVIARSDSDEAIHLSSQAMDCFASLAMTETDIPHYMRNRFEDIHDQQFLV
jgi:hypothetical protein